MPVKALEIAPQTAHEADPKTQSLVGRILWPLGPEDRLPAALSGLLSLAVYVYTLAPSVTFKDSGELIVAALHFGVPHPTGYPLWTFLAGLFALLPLGPGAWEVNLFSAVCAAASAAITAALAHRMILRRTALPTTARASAKGGRFAASLPAICISVGVGLVFAFSVSVWSQAVFAEVYTLHILVAAFFWWALYRWFLEPGATRNFLLCIFFLALGMSNHHLMLALAPLPFLVAILRRRALAWELIGYAVAAGSIFYLAFASIADSDITWETATRTGQLAFLLLVALLLARHRLQHWRLGLMMIPTVALGLLPYAYMPLASATNPPMNWGYTQTADGFYYSINRSPYRGPLSEQLMGTLGRLVGTAATEEAQADLPPVEIGLPKASARELLSGFASRYLLESSRSFTLLSWPLILFAGWLLRRRVEERGWFLVLGSGFVLSALFQPASAAFAGAAGRLEWDLQMPYLGYSYIPLALLLAYGFLALRESFEPRSRLLAHLVVLAAALAPLVGLFGNAEQCSQRDRWFGWQYGHDMLADLPAGAVVFGGGDAGRFIPTYMIFGESFEKPKFKRDPDFDRRDLYIITQTQLLVRFYRSYIRDHYGLDRPEPGALGSLLGREQMYPEKALILPTEDDVAVMIQRRESAGRSVDTLHHDIAEWIYRANRDEHAFFVEDSIGMAWTEPLAVPAGPLYRLADAPVAELTDEQIEADQNYWLQRSASLLEDPAFEHDLDAQLAFSALRIQGGKVYRQRGLIADAEAAFRGAMDIMPNELVSHYSLASLFATQHRFREAREVLAPLRGYSPILTAADRSWAGRQRVLERRGAEQTQLMLAPHDNRVVGRIYQSREEGAEVAEIEQARLVDLAADLKLFKDDPANTVAVRRILGVYRGLEVHSLANHISQRRLVTSPSRRLLQLVVADQSIQPARLDTSGRGVRLLLASKLIEVGESNLALQFLRGQERDEDMLRLRAAARKLRETQEALDPILDRWQQSGSTIQTQAAASDDSLAARLERLGVAMSSFTSQPDPSRLRQFVSAAWRLRLPARARQVLIDCQGKDDAVLAEAVRLAAFDVLPATLLPLADTLEAREPSSPEAWLNIASLRFAGNDQAGMQRAILSLERLVGRDGLLRGFNGDPMLRELVLDERFHRFLRGMEAQSLEAARSGTEG